MLRRSLLPAAAVVAAGSLTAQAQNAEPDQNLSRIQRTKKLRMAVVVGEDPYFHKDITTGQWSGFCVEMGRDMAKALDVEMEVLESGWGNSVLDLQANKADIMFGLNPTPARGLAINMSDPIFFNSFALGVRRGFEPKTWSDVNKPEVHIAVDLGSSHELIARRYAPKADITAYKTRNEAVLAVQSGRADCFVATIFIALDALKKNPSLSFRLLQPLVRAPVCAGMRYDDNRRFRDFVNTWIAFNASNGQVREWIVASLDKIGIDPKDVPPEVTF
jgi:polar amino acid transport system substrate-binding protein